MTDHVRVPIRIVNGTKWGALGHFGNAHEICGEKAEKIEEKFSFAGGHRVRLYRFKKSVHWRIPEGVQIDIATVQPSAAPRRTWR